MRGFAFGSRLCGRFGNRPGELSAFWDERAVVGLGGVLGR